MLPAPARPAARSGLATHASSGEPYVIHNPISGEKIIVRTSGAETNGRRLLVSGGQAEPCVGRRVPVLVRAFS